MPRSSLRTTVHSKSSAGCGNAPSELVDSFDQHQEPLEQHNCWDPYMFSPNTARSKPNTPNTLRSSLLDRPLSLPIRPKPPEERKESIKHFGAPLDRVGEPLPQSIWIRTSGLPPLGFWGGGGGRSKGSGPGWIAKVRDLDEGMLVGR